MVKLWIDNQEVNVEKGTTILDAAASVGIKIPTLCFLKDDKKDFLQALIPVEVLIFFNSSNLFFALN